MFRPTLGVSSTQFRLCAIAFVISLWGPTSHVAAQADDSEDEEIDKEVDDSAKAISPAGSPSPRPEKTAIPPPPPAAPPSPFVFILHGLVSTSLFAQDVPSVGYGTALTFGPFEVATDKWFLGGDIRQTRVTLSIRGPEVLAGGTPTGVVEMDIGGYNYQITPVGGLSAVVGTNARGAMGEPMAPVAIPYNVVTNEPRSDENLVPRVRLAYLEVNWGASQNVLRVGQYHNLLLSMIAGSASHTNTPIGYGAGQLGWRSPGVTYIHRFRLSLDSSIDIGLQAQKNSWRDELPTCAPQQMSPAANCQPLGVSHAEASMLPQVQARIMAFGGMATEPLPFYLPMKWLAYVAGSWDRKDMTGVGSATLPPAAPGSPVLRDTMETWAVQGGLKTQLGPLLLAANGWYGLNSGSLFGNMFQMQDLSGPDVHGFGAWGQIGLGLFKHVSVWGFAGIDRPNEAEAIRAAPYFRVSNTTRLQNVQIVGQIAYTEGPIMLAVEWMYVATKNYIPAVMPTGTMPGRSAGWVTLAAHQPSITLNYNF
ncbi:MAG: hypothetical protein ABW321_12210 [Polyangiales bacterium]